MDFSKNQIKNSWSSLPKELLIKIFTIVYNEDSVELLPIARVCSNWNSIVKNNLIQDYENYLNGIKVYLKCYRLRNNNLVLNNLFTCFHLVEYGKDYLFWPNSNNISYCSEVHNNCQVISYDILSQNVEYINLTGSRDINAPTDVFRYYYRQFNKVSPFDDSDHSIDFLRQNRFPAFNKTQYTICLYHLGESEVINTVNSSLRFKSNPIKYFLNTNKKLNFSAVSSNNKYLALAFSGLVQIYNLPSSVDQKEPISLNDLTPIFSKQFPSIIKFLSIDDNCHVLFVRSLRLGGLSMMNLITNEEIEFPHYRLDLNMNSQINDHIILLNGYQETIAYGLPMRNDPDNKEQQNEHFNNSTSARGYNPITKKYKLDPVVAPIWDYYENYISAGYEHIIPLTNIVPVDAPKCYIGLLKSHSFPNKSEPIFSGGDRSLDLVLFIDNEFPSNIEKLRGRYLEDFKSDSYNHYFQPEDSDEDLINAPDDISCDGDLDDDDYLSEQFRIVPLIFNIQHLTRSPLFTVSNDGKRFAILISNVLYVLNTSSDSVRLLLNKFQSGNYRALDLLTTFNLYSHPNDIRIELATKTSITAEVSSGSLGSTDANKNRNINNTWMDHSNIVLVDQLYQLGEYRSQHKKLNNSNSILDSDDDEEYLTEDDEFALNSDAETIEQRNHNDIVDGAHNNHRIHRHHHRNLDGHGLLSSTNEEVYKTQITWIDNNNIAINFKGSFSAIFSLEKYV
ncbi:hypothetical protein PACTADRAFT_47457 [Pachysolen tannophilus NRRL Y-2460]|uniref:F-box domain-containing protein n=1 Tax=Pachysolen tannophilus NRRL Y-2460 TaxID=669874 RepID=A0A1E4U0L3_PACTA|nr:hypothetical protein PACTADRAFT_47457 [Pachysolen tannophilus NRRL Y-2460]